MPTRIHLFTERERERERAWTRYRSGMMLRHLPVGAETISSTAELSANGQAARGIVQRSRNGTATATEQSRPVLPVDGLVPGLDGCPVAEVDRLAAVQFVAPIVPLFSSADRRQVHDHLIRKLVVGHAAAATGDCRRRVVLGRRVFRLRLLVSCHQQTASMHALPPPRSTFNDSAASDLVGVLVHRQGTLTVSFSNVDPGGWRS